MRTILVANRKGGCGKTTVATNIAAALAARGHAVALADADRQKSALKWLSLRPKAAARIVGLNWCKDKNLGDTPTEIDTVVIDGPGALSTSHAETLIGEANEIVVPLLPSLFDTDSTDRFLAKIEKLKKVRKGKADILMVANRVRLRSQALARLEAHQAEAGRPLMARISDRAAYSHLASEGLTIFDSAGREFTPLRNQWQPLLLALEV
ncbi:chromosome partitioning protein [Breoghania corrubedonensis]|uniref:Chromosome partitioning protein n=1 Tax=Breoghania corrubedonensis TaxID=665038 RepID=A0A2T5V9L7_9HYPH|nr:ParA family protein [Breoghania corrubedonensis]PTW60421.1 chromosome partitioning protein [Breoghania corrubedonensis]